MCYIRIVIEKNYIMIEVISRVITQIIINIKIYIRHIFNINKPLPFAGHVPRARSPFNSEGVGIGGDGSITGGHMTCRRHLIGQRRSGRPLGYVVHFEVFVDFAHPVKELLGRFRSERSTGVYLYLTTAV